MSDEQEDTGEPSTEPETEDTGVEKRIDWLCRWALSFLSVVVLRRSINPRNSLCILNGIHMSPFGLDVLACVWMLLDTLAVTQNT